MVNTLVFGTILLILLLSEKISSDNSQKINKNSLLWVYYNDPVSVTLTYFSRSQATLKSNFRKFTCTITQKIKDIGVCYFKFVHHNPFSMTWNKKNWSHSCGTYRNEERCSFRSRRGLGKTKHYRKMIMLPKVSLGMAAWQCEFG